MSACESAKKLRLCVGCVSPLILEVIDDERVGLIPSWNQVSSNVDRSYIRVDTGDLKLKLASDDAHSNIFVQRDHAGLKYHDWRNELLHDVYHLDAIHVDPWATHTNVASAASATAALIKFCEKERAKYDHLLQPLVYEIGTEQGIRKYGASELDSFLSGVRNQVGSAWERVLFAVVQTGTNVKDLGNIANTHDQYDENDCQVIKAMTRVCEKHGVWAKEHSSDFMTDLGLRVRADLGVRCFNVAPEFGTIQSRVIEGLLIECGFANELYSLVEHVNRQKTWLPWVSRSLCLAEKDEVGRFTAPFFAFEAAAHYHIHDDVYQMAVRRLEEIGIDWRQACKKAIHDRIEALLCVIDNR